MTHEERVGTIAISPNSQYGNRTAGVREIVVAAV
jgi:hypothetical protein